MDAMAPFQAEDALIVGWKGAVLSTPRRGGGELQRERLRLKMMLLWLFEVVVEKYGLVKTASTEGPLPAAVTA